MNDPLQLLLKWFDVAILALIGLVVVYAGMTFISADPELVQASEKIQDYAKQLESNQKLQSEPSLESLALADKAREQILMDRVPEGKPFPRWALHRKPYLLTAFIGPPPDLIPLHFPPGNVSAAATRGQVTVRWDENLQNKYVVVKGYEIHRRDSEGGEWKVVGKATANDREYVDKEVKAQSSYWYKVVSVADVDTGHPRIRTFRGEVTLADDKKIQESDEVGPAETPRDVYMIPTFAQIPDPVKQPGKKKKAFVKVYKWDSAASEWIKPKQYSIEEGEDIGDLTPGIGKQPEVDRRTGAKLVDCGEDVTKEKIAGSETEITRKYYWIVVRFPDGSEVRFDNLTVPDEIKDVR